MSKDLTHIYKGSFKDRVNRFDDGGLSYVSVPSSAQYLQYDPSTMQVSQAPYTLPDTTVTAPASTSTGALGNVTPADIAALTGAGSGTTGVDAPVSMSGQTLTDPLSGENLNIQSDSGSSTAGALGSLLKALGIGGGSTTAAGIQALSGLLAAAGQYKQNAAYAPTNNTAAAALNNSSAAGSGATGAAGASGGTQFGPAGGYNYKNYSGLTGGSTAGLGYAPRTYTPPTAAQIPNYYTYGQQPQPSNFTNTPGMKRGGHVSTPQRFDMGGQPNMGIGALNTGMLPTMPNPMAGGITSGGPAHPTGMPQMGLPPRPQAGLPPRPMATGGGLPPAPVSRHVKGPGDGTSDDIPARLATGEYVMDAQTVSMAGNGDNAAGAKALDKFREHLRQHKGGALAQGKMAPDAKPLEQYMPKGSQ